MSTVGKLQNLRILRDFLGRSLERGLLDRIAPVGNFINNGELYSYYKTSRLAVFTESNGTLSVDGCEMLVATLLHTKPAHQK
ncbi:hypothetical protein GCK72_004050 [Caenorhabditis remanei]|uniref:Uncharacterized protein n=1 Tax=Caenorhabditis remanei TaxID=31234 RepID=A0A6A5HB90_CAERE|nr:hypothetical protein GCK72_004050 [Caenorhabditis remanei]KAF1764104.1 hypothetical protein GCK72_004050 [Caenorhabditis remanei]